MKSICFILFSVCLLCLYSCKENEIKNGVSGEKQDSVQSTETDSKQGDTLAAIQSMLAAGKNKEALQQLNNLLAITPKDPALLYSKARALENTDQTDSAIVYYEETLRITGKLTDASGRLANLYAEKGDARALSICKNLLKEPTAASVRSDIMLIEAIYYIQNGEKQKANATLDQIIREDYTYLEAYIEKGLILYEEQKYEQALKIFEKSTSVKNSFADGYFWIAQCEEKMNRKDDAIANFKRAVALDPGFSEARDALKRLGALQ